MVKNRLKHVTFGVREMQICLIELAIKDKVRALCHNLKNNSKMSSNWSQFAIHRCLSLDVDVGGLAPTVGACFFVWDSTARYNEIHFLQNKLGASADIKEKNALI